MAQKPILFLDVDGVLNCFRSEDCDHVMAGPLPVYIPRETKERIKELAVFFDIVWCTAWFGNAHPSFREHLDLPDESWPYVSWNQLKLTEILKWAKGRPWAWADDDIDMELDDLGWDEDRYLPDNCLLLRINPNVGLTWDDTEELIRFAEDNTPVKADETEPIA